MRLKAKNMGNPTFSDIVREMPADFLLFVVQNIQKYPVAEN
jgi:hypothetical protein